MINPLLHPHSSSAPTSPRCTRQIRIRNRTTVVSTAGNVVMRAVPKKYRDMSPSRRRLSRVVKCRTVDFTEFPEGMRDYYSGVRNKPLLREIHSQPGSPVIPRIEIYDFGSEVLLIITHYFLKSVILYELWVTAASASFLKILIRVLYEVVSGFNWVQTQPIYVFQVSTT